MRSQSICNRRSRSLRNSMGSRGMLLLALAIVSAFPFLSTTGATETASDAYSWDIVVACGNEIHFFKNDTDIRKSTVANIYEITNLAYDSVNRTLYISDYFDIHSAVVEENLDSELTSVRILHTSDAAIQAMVFDPVTKTLFWVGSGSPSGGSSGGLMKMEVASYGIDAPPKISKLHDLSGVYYLTLDICHRFIYWTSHGDKGGSIERSRLDGTDREEIVKSDGPDYFHGLTVDHYGGKLYFGTTGGYLYTNIKIEERNLDGTDRKVLVNSSYEKVGEPDRLAVDDTAVYWADSDIAWISGVFKNGTTKRAMKTSSSQVYFIRITSNILTRHDVEGIDCKAVLDKEQMRTLEPLLAQSQLAAKLEQLSNEVARLSTNQNQLLFALTDLLENARLTQAAAISRIDALKPDPLETAPKKLGLSNADSHPEN